VRKVNTSGAVIYRSDFIYLSKSLSGELVLLEPVDSDRRFFDVYFSDFLIGRMTLSTAQQKTLPSRSEVTFPMSPVSSVTPSKPPLGNT
jgi:hypothetical protein